MALSSASREKLTEGGLVRALLTGQIRPRRRPQFRALLDEAPVAMLKGMAKEVAKYVQPGVNGHPIMDTCGHRIFPTPH